LAKIEKIAEGQKNYAEFLRADNFMPEAILYLNITGEAKLVITEFESGEEERLHIPVELNGTEYILSAGKKLRNKIIDNSGNETENWIGLVLVVKVVDYPSLGHNGFTLIKIKET